MAPYGASEAVQSTVRSSEATLKGILQVFLNVFSKVNPNRSLGGGVSQSWQICDCSCLVSSTLGGHGRRHVVPAAEAPKRRGDDYEKLGSRRQCYKKYAGGNTHSIQMTSLWLRLYVT